MSRRDPDCGNASAEYDYSYDALGRAALIEHQIAGLTPMVSFAQQFDAAGQPEGLKRYADSGGTQLVAETAWSFDGAGRLTDLTHAKGAATLADYDWQFDAAGRMTRFVSSNDGTVDYTNDATGQLTGADYDYQSDETYVYDENGNRVNNGYTTGPNNQMTSDGTYTYLYDAEGNRTQKFVDNDTDGQIGAGDTDITQYAWDHRNRLVKVEHFATHTAYNGSDPDKVVEYAYDHGNRWVRKVLDTNGDGTTDSSAIFVYDNNQITLQFDHAGTGAAATSDLTHRYLWGTAVDQILADETADDGGAEDVLWPLTDHLNTVRDLASYDPGTDTTTIANHLTYDAFGNVTTETTPTVNTLFQFTARPFDPDTGLQNNLNRWYDLITGRWMSEDPAGGDLNPYRYVANQPLSFIDRAGLWKQIHYPHIWEAESEDTFQGLVRLLGEYDRSLANIDVKKYMGAILPFEVSMQGICFDDKGDRFHTQKRYLKRARLRWGMKKPATCMWYNTAQIARHAKNQLPEGAFLRLAIGNPANEFGMAVGFLEGATTFFDATNVTQGGAAELVRRLAEASNRGRTPIKNLWVIGHCAPGRTSIGGGFSQDRLGNDVRFDIPDLGGLWWQSYDDAAGYTVTGPTGEEAPLPILPPGFWFRGDAEVRFIGCVTRRIAEAFGTNVLRDEAKAFGTTDWTQAMDVGGVSTMRFWRFSGIRPVPIPNTESVNPEQFFAKPHWKSFPK